MPVNPHLKGGADVPVTDGGTGASTGSGGLANLGGLDNAAHALINHAGLPGVGDLSTAAHGSLDHTGIPGVRLVDWTYVDTTSVVSCTATAVQDDSIPTTSEGTLVLTTPSFTPKSTANFLEISFSCMGGTNANTRPILFFCRDGGNAFFTAQCADIDANIGDVNAKLIVPLSVGLTNHASGIAARTYSVRIGVTAGFEFTVNGFAGARLFGGTARATLMVKEIAP